MEIRRLTGGTPEAVELHMEMSAEMEVLLHDRVDDGTGGYVFPQKFEAGSAFLLGYEDEVAIACGGYRPYAERVAEIKRMYVRPAYRGQGHSKAILAAIEEAARSDGYSKVILETTDRQLNAISLYEKSGYRRVPNYFPYEDVAWCLCFEKEL
jgi:putative acetyltransferase